MLELYEHNKSAYAAALEMMQCRGKAAVIHPTGTGKSIIAFKLIEEHPEARVCWLSPSKYIVQTQRENVCRLEPNFSDENVQYLTYARLMNMDREELDAICPDFIILDEFHRCGASEWGKGVEALLKTYPATPALGLSATNIRYLDHQRDMASELFDGNVASEMSVAEAIATGILPSPTYVIAMFSYQKELENYQRRVNSIRHRSNFDQNRRYLEALRRALEMSVGLDRVFEKHMKNKSGKYIVFCSGKEHMDSVRQLIPEWFAGVDREPHVYSVYSEDLDSEQAFLDFKNDGSAHLKLLLCIDMLSEGIHVEDISGVILLRPTVSPIVYKQQIGRGLAAGKGGSPLIFDIVNNFENLSSAAYLQEEMQAVAALYRERGLGGQIVEETFRVIDEVRECRALLNQLEESLGVTWEANYHAARVYYDTYGKLDVPVNYRTDSGIQLGVWLSYQRQLYSGKYRGSLTPERIEKLNRIGMIWENRYDHHWEICFRVAEEYYVNNGDLQVPVGYVSEDGIQLGRWLRRQAEHKEKLPEEKIRRLNEIGMVWENQWESRYASALSFLQKNPEYELTQTTVIDNFWVGKWLVQQLRARQKGTLNPRQAAMMDELVRQTGISVETKSQKKWNEHWQEAKRLTDRYGSWKAIPDKRIQRWIRSQLQRLEAGQMPRNLAVQLKSIGVYPERKEDPWMAFYRHAEAYYKANGDLDVPAAYVTAEGVRLGAWLSKQRSIRRNSMTVKGLSEHQIRLLEDIGIDWNPHRSAFERGMNAVERYYTANGDLNVPSGYIDASGFPLSQWISDVRKKKDKLPQEDICRLDSMNFKWRKRREKQKGECLLLD